MFVMSQLYMNTPLPLSDLDLWLAPGSKKYATSALVSLDHTNAI